MSHRFITAPRLDAASAGAGLKLEHGLEILERGTRIDFFEVHAENYMGEGGLPHHVLHRIRERHPVSLHGVGLSIGADHPLDRDHLARLKLLIERYEPDLFSEHLAWSTHDGAFLNDLLPLPYTEATLARVCQHIDEVQSALGRRMLLENPSTYVRFEASTLSETDFLRAVVARTGCGLLLDVNNVHVSAVNHGFEPMAYLDAFPLEQVGEIHLAGFDEDRDDDGAPLLIDAHGCPVAEPVWALYARTLGRLGPIPTLIEWDNNVPELPEFEAQVARAKTHLVGAAARRARHCDVNARQHREEQHA
jgi:uncharacterized protein